MRCLAGYCKRVVCLKHPILSLLSGFKGLIQQHYFVFFVRGLARNMWISLRIILNRACNTTLYKL